MLFRLEHLEYLNGFNIRARHGEKSRVDEKSHCSSILACNKPGAMYLALNEELKLKGQ